MADQTPVSQNRAERILAFMVAAAVGVSLLSFIAIIIATAAGMGQADFGSGLWPVISMLPLVGLPLGFVLIIALMIVSLIRRRREAKDAG